MRIYLSSTDEDLKEYRQEVANALRNCGHNLDAMEKYSARDDRPKAASEDDASKCDLYIGIFAWRYGHVPEEDNPEGKSITELEYLAAGRAQKPRLIFLLADDAPWPSSLRDAEQNPDQGKRIRDLRNRLKTERWAGFFRSPDDLAKRVLTSVFQHESTKRVDGLAALDQIQSAGEMGPSYLPNIQQQIETFGSLEFVSLRLGPTPWWNTRMHLVAALASDFTEIRQFVLLDVDGHFLTMASPAEIRRALAKAFPKLEIAYLQTQEQTQGLNGGEVDLIVSRYPATLTAVFGGQEERDLKHVVTPAGIRELGIKQEGEVVEQYGAERKPLSNSELLRRRTPYVVLVRNGTVEGVIDRLDLASRIASTAFQ
jgi:Domain of unknown function (DUF4062)